MDIKSRAKRKPVSTDKDIKNLHQVELLQEAVVIEMEKSYMYERCFHSLHESESVIREELEETSEELNKVRQSFEELHVAMRNDAVDAYVESLGYLRQHAWDLVREAIQVVAMANKSIDSFEEESLRKAAMSSSEEWHHFDLTT